MKYLHRLFAVAISAAFFVSAAQAQNAGTVTANAFAIGKGAGTTGYASLLCTSAQLAVGQSAAAPVCTTITGDVTLSAAGAVTLATVNANVGSFGSATNCPAFTVNAKGLITAASATTCTPAVGSITGLGTGIATFLATPNSANLRAAITDEVGTGAAYFVGGALGTPASGTATNLTGLPPSGLTTQGAYTFLGNNTGSAASPTAVDIATLTSKASPASTDLVMISDQAASGAWKKVTVSSLASAGSVASIGGLTGVVGVASGITTSGSNIIADQKWRGFVTSAQYGVTCDGTTDDSTNMQTFLTALGTSPYPLGIVNGTTGGSVCYMGTTTLTFKGYSVIQGGTGQTTLKWNASKTGNLMIAAASTDQQVSVSNLIIDGTTKGSQTAFRVIQTSMWMFHNLQVNNVDTCFLFDASGTASNYQWGTHVYCGTANFGYYFSGISNSNTLVGARCNNVGTCVNDQGNNNASIHMQMENVTTAIRLDSTSAGYTSLGDRCENATTCFLTVSGAVKAAYINPHIAGTITTRVNDAANALVNSLFEYQTKLSFNSAVGAQTSVDTLVNTGVMANCKGDADVTAAQDGGAASAGIIVTGMYRNGTGPYYRVTNITSGSLTPNMSVVLTCRQRS